MENIQTESSCKHSKCKCAHPVEGDYCSDYCERVDKGGTLEECLCGHPECSE